jgi:gliding motility-associated-like protein
VITDNADAINTLTWNKAIGRAGQIFGYNLYRIHKSTGDIDSVLFSSNAFQNYYEDDLSDEIDQDGSYCYVVEVLEKRDTAVISNGFSNMACGLIDPRVWIPNAFVISGASPTFKPVFAYADLNNYKMYILNRPGDVLFTSEDSEIGWDGSYKGNPVMQGVYVYIIEFRDGNNKLIVEKGTVTVFR